MLFSGNPMDKKIKTRWERQMRKVIITLVIVLPATVGLFIWLLARLSRLGP
jgi:hypothetical protein